VPVLSNHRDEVLLRRWFLAAGTAVLLVAVSAIGLAMVLRHKSAPAPQRPAPTVERSPAAIAANPAPTVPPQENPTVAGRALPPASAPTPPKTRTAIAKKRSQRAPRPQRTAGTDARILELIGRPKGATLSEIVKATEAPPGAVYNFLATAAEKHGIDIASSKNATGDRVYRIAK
jgi:hypothetical protein